MLTILPFEFDRVVELLQFPFMQQALLGGVLTGAMGGLLGSFTILRQLSFFSDALSHSVLLGISFGMLLGLEPAAVILPSAILFAIGVAYLLEKMQLWTDAMLNLIYSSSLALALIILGSFKQYQGGLESLLFGDILAVRNSDLIVSRVLLVACIAFACLTLGT